MNQFLPEGRIYQNPAQRQLLQTPEGLQTAMEQQLILEAVPNRCDTGHNLHFTLGRLQAVMPREECAFGITEGTAREISILSRVGKPTCFFVESLIAEDGVLVPQLSRRAVQLQCLDTLMRLSPGTIIPATVTHLAQFGAFVDVGCGVPSLIPLDTISVSRIPHPSCRFQPGDEIFAVVRAVLPDENRLLLSHKELLGNWSENAERFRPGEVVTGTVRGVLDYGIFVELLPNLPALAEYTPGIENGDRVSVFIKSILPEREKIKLLILGRAEEERPCLPPLYFLTSGHIQDWSYHNV